MAPRARETITDAARRAVDGARGCNGVVVAAGGDGTLNAVAQVVLGSGCVFGVIPLGTFNLFARTHGIPLEPAAAAQVLLEHPAQPVQAGRVNDLVFLVNASLGLYSDLLEDREAYKAQLGRSRLVAVGSGLRSLLRQHRQLHLSIEQQGRDRSLRSPAMFVGNNRLQLQRLGLEQAPSVEQGQLIALVVRPIGTLALLGLALRGALGRLGQSENLDHFCVRRMQVVIRGRKQVKVAVDGEVHRLRPPLCFAVADVPLMLIKPAVAPDEDPA
jgi:diacylglycerol kinase family enzyme